MKFNNEEYNHLRGKETGEAFKLYQNLCTEGIELKG